MNASYDWDAADVDDFKELILPDESQELFFELRSVFEQAGYKVRRLEVCNTHPVLVLKLLRHTAPVIKDAVKLLGHISFILCETRVGKTKVTVSREGDRIHVSFLTESILDD
jgi:hypothetical protein